MLPLALDAVNPQISMNDNAASLRELAHFLYQFISRVSWQFSELPIFHTNQMLCHKVNHIIRHVKELLNPNHPSIIPWDSLSSPRTKNLECLKPSYIEILKKRHLPYESIDGKHLSSNGYLLWLQDHIYGAVLAIVEQSEFKAKENFNRKDTISVNVDRSVYFQTTTDTQRVVENDLLDIDLLVRLRELRHPRIDCSAIKIAYPDPIPPTLEIAEVQVVPAPTSVHEPRSRNPRIIPYDGGNRTHRSNRNHDGRGFYDRAYRY